MWKNLLKSENYGTILKDEEYANTCRITLKKHPDCYAITCGIYGAMTHTAFCGENYQNIYDQMKRELQEFIDSNCQDSGFYDRFTNKF